MRLRARGIPSRSESNYHPSGRIRTRPGSTTEKLPAQSSRAVIKSASRCPTLLGLDIGMRSPNGFEVCRRIRSMNLDSPPLLIACTGWGQEEYRREGRMAGFDHHLIKPIEPDAILGLVAQRATQAPPPGS